MDLPFFKMMMTTNGPSGSENQDKIYAIFRVFRLGMETTGLRIYVDPYEQRRTGKLDFWRVRCTGSPRDLGLERCVDACESSDRNALGFLLA